MDETWWRSVEPRRPCVGKQNLGLRLTSLPCVAR